MLHPIFSAMKKPARLLLSLTFTIALAGCQKAGTVSVEPSHPVPPAENAESAVADAAPAQAQATKPEKGDDNALFAGLSPEDREKYEAWFKKYNLSTDPAVLDQDSDGDGYSNREEFLAGTNPRDPLSLPGVVEGVSVKEVKEVSVPIILREVKDGKARVEWREGGAQEELKQGSQPKGLPYRVTGVRREVKADKHGVFTDVSNVTLENPDTKEKILLVRDLPARSSETHAIITGADGVEQKVRLDETITLPGQGTKKFKVMELRQDQVVVEEISTKRPLTIPMR